MTDYIFPIIKFAVIAHWNFRNLKIEFNINFNRKKKKPKNFKAIFEENIEQNNCIKLFDYYFFFNIKFWCLRYEKVDYLTIYRFKQKQNCILACYVESGSVSKNYENSSRMTATCF